MTELKISENISHELRTLMHQVLNFKNLCLEKFDQLDKEEIDPLDMKEIERYHENISKNGIKLLECVENPLDLLKIETQDAGYRFEKIDIKEIIQTEITNLDVWGKKKKIKFQKRYGQTSGGLIGDQSKLHQMIKHILSNAVHYTKYNSTITVRLSDTNIALDENHSESPTTPALKIVIKDQGIGIPENELKLIFTKFVTGSNTCTRSGMKGLGLANSKEIVHFHRGTIRAENNFRGGASFGVVLPRLQTLPNSPEA